jgi:Tol biopolymer transport system component
VLSKNGARVAFVSAANGVVPGDTNGADDVYVVDVVAPTTITRVSAPSSGDANGASSAPALSGDGSVVVFETTASNLATGGPADGNGVADVMRVNLAQGLRNYISTSSSQLGNGPSTAPSVSADGRVIAFASTATNLGGGASGVSNVYLYNLDAQGAPQLASGTAAGPGNGASSAPTLSADGTMLAFVSAATDLVPGDGNAKPDVFVLDRVSFAKRRIARGDGGTQSNGESLRPRLSRDGQHVGFHSLASNLSLLDLNGEQSDVFLNGPLEPFLIFRARFD